MTKLFVSIASPPPRFIIAFLVFIISLSFARARDLKLVFPFQEGDHCSKPHFKDTMGITSSTPDAHLTQEQEDVKFLGERMPYGDAELVHVYRAYQRMKSTVARRSFLVDIGIAAVDEASREEYLVLLQTLEEKVLIPEFSNRWYQVAFVPPGLNSEYITPSPPSQQSDSYTQRAQLESFFDGVSNSSRRGNGKALRVLFDCCQPQTSSNADESSPPMAPPLPLSDFAYNTHPSTSQSSTIVIDPLELITIAYRVGLAAGFLSATLKEDGRDVSNFSPESDVGSAGIKALAASLVDYTNKRKQRLHHIQNPSTTYVSWEEVKEWAEHSAPMLGAALATFTQLIFFPNRPDPPTRTSFDFPDLAEFTSTFISKGSSSLLFNLACMSPSLGGEVSLRCCFQEISRMPLNSHTIIPLHSTIGYTHQLPMVSPSTDYKMRCWDMVDLH